MLGQRVSLQYIPGLTVVPPPSSVSFIFHLLSPVFILSTKMDLVRLFLCTDLLHLSLVTVYFHFLFNNVPLSKSLMTYAFCFLFLVYS